jgi:hypothetical protein
MQNSLPYPHLSMPSIQDLGGPQMKRQRTESFSPETKGIKVFPFFASGSSDKGQLLLHLATSNTAMATPIGWHQILRRALNRKQKYPIHIGGQILRNPL